MVDSDIRGESKFGSGSYGGSFRVGTAVATNIASEIG